MKKKNSNEKDKWSEIDFEQMTWHDCKVHAIAFDTIKNEILFDIDFILKWVLVGQYENQYHFIVAPATLVFRNVYDISLNLLTVEFIIDKIERENPIKPKNSAYIKEQVEYDWSIETTNGVISFKSVGFNQYLRKEPIISNCQYLNLVERGGVAY